MIMNKLHRCLATQCRNYTVIVERYTKPPIVKAHQDQRKRDLKSDHYQLKFVDCLHNKKWGNIDLILTEYVEGVGHKGEIVNVPRHTAYYELLPSRQAVYVTEEYLKLYEKDRQALAGKAKVSPFAKRTKDELEKSVIEIPLNMSVEWKLNEDLLRIALRYNVKFYNILFIKMFLYKIKWRFRNLCVRMRVSKCLKV